MEKRVIMAPDKGINKNDPAFLIDDRAWSDGNNVRFGRGYVEKVKGYEPFLNFPSAWAAGTYTLGAYVVPTVANNHVYKCTTAGTTGAAEPKWQGTVTITIASPCVVTWTGHGLAAGNVIRFTTTGALPTGVTAATDYYVIATGLAANAFQFSATLGGAAVNTSGTQSGIHTAMVKVRTDGTAVWTDAGVNKLSGVLMALDNYFQFDGDAYLMAITTTNVYVYNEVDNTFTDITGATSLNGSTDHPVVTENAQDYFVFTNGVDPIKYWTGSGNIADLPGLTDAEGGVTQVKAKTLLYFQNFLLLGHTTENGNPKPQRIRWSCLGDITKWKNVTNDINQQQAGWADLTDSVDWVQAMRPLGNYVVAYKERSIQLFNYVGGDAVWNKWPAIIGVGMISTKGFVDLGDEHIFIGNDNIYSFDGREPAIAGDDIAKEFFLLLDPDKYDLITGFYIEEVPEIWFSFVSGNSLSGYPDKAITYNPDTKAWSFRDMPMTTYGYYNLKESLTIDGMEFTIDSWNTEIDSSSNLSNAPINLAGNSAGEIYVLRNEAFNGAAIDSNLESKLFDMDDPTHIKRLLRIQFMISREGPYNLPVYVGTAENVDEPVVWYGPYNMSLDKTTPPWVDVDISARYLKIRIGTKGAFEPFRLTGYILYYELRGEV